MEDQQFDAERHETNTWRTGAAAYARQWLGSWGILGLEQLEGNLRESMGPWDAPSSQPVNGDSANGEQPVDAPQAEGARNDG